MTHLLTRQSTKLLILLLNHSVAQNLHDLELGSQDMKVELAGLYISSAKEVMPCDMPNIEIEVGHGKKAIIIFVPVPLAKQFHKIQTRLVRELEKKFSDRHILFVAQRRIMAKPSRNARVAQKRPRSRTLTSVHEKLLEDMVFPTEIVGMHQGVIDYQKEREQRSRLTAQRS